MQLISKSKIAQAIVNDLKKDIAILIAQRSDKELERECLDIARDEFVKQKNWIKVESYNKAHQRVNSEIEDLNDIISPRLSELKRIEENGNKNMA